MRLLFVHDHPFFVDGNKVYSGGGLPSEIWTNYLINFSQVCVFGRHSTSEKDRKVQSSREHVHFNLTKSYGSPLSLLRNYKKIVNEINQEVVKADVILVRLPSVIGFVTGQLAKKQGKYLWVEQVGNAQEAFSSFGTILGRIVAPIFQQINKKLVREANFVTYVTQRQLQLIYPSSNHSITASLSNVKLESLLEESQLNTRRFDGSIIDIGVIGGFDVRYKGQDVLLKAISFLPIEIKQTVRLHLVGKGDYNWLMLLASELGISETIAFKGALTSGDEVTQFLRKMSLYVQPSLTEGLPRSTIEAMGAGCPVIGSNAGGIIELVSGRFIHQAGNATELMEHILLLCNDRALLIEEARRSLKCAESYLYSNLTMKRKDFYIKMNDAISIDSSNK